MKKLFSLIALASLWLFMALPVFAADVTNATAQQMGSRVQFTYDLIGQEREANVNFRVTVDGKTRSAADLHLEGDYRKVRTGTGKVAYWNVLQDYPKGYNGRISWEITAGGNYTGKWEIAWQEGAKTEIRTVDITQNGSRISGKNNNGYFFEGTASDDELTILYKYLTVDEVRIDFPAMPDKPRKDLIGRISNEYELRRIPGTDNFEGRRASACVEWNNDRIVKTTTKEFWGACKSTERKVVMKRIR